MLGKSPTGVFMSFLCCLQVLKKKKLGGGFKYFLCSPLLGEDSHFDKYFCRWVETETTNWKKSMVGKGLDFLRHVVFWRPLDARVVLSKTRKLCSYIYNHIFNRILIDIIYELWLDDICMYSIILTPMHEYTYLDTNIYIYKDMYSYIYIDMNSIHLHIWTLSVCNGFCTEDDDDDWWSRDSQKLSTRFHKNAPRFSVVSTMLFGSRNHDATQFLPKLH